MGRFTMETVNAAIARSAEQLDPTLGVAALRNIQDEGPRRMAQNFQDLAVLLIGIVLAVDPILWLGPQMD